jgi:alginate O-acetyltransferase complex protein AlgI
MLFSSLVFITLFLPTVVLIHWLLPTIKLKNSWLILSSLIFYFWGETSKPYIILIIVLINYCFAILLTYIKAESLRLTSLILFLIANFSILSYFKYFNFILSVLAQATRLQLPNFNEVALPIGISFFTFQAVSYLIDVYKKEYKYSKNIFDFLLYVILFPQLIAGPIVLFSQVKEEIKERIININSFYTGFIRFTLGLGKKVLIANNIGIIADQIIALPSLERDWYIAFVGIFCYSIQIYFDFSGYSDMAIGIGKMLGFNFPENFAYPYTSRSIQEFWRRWNITLSSWFKNYLYIPLGGSRVRKFRLYFNLLVIFLATGVWHGAGWNFILWGLINGLFIVIERMFLSKILNKLPSFISYFYSLPVIMLSWIFFRIETLGGIEIFLKDLLRVDSIPNFEKIFQYLTIEKSFFLLIGILIATGIPEKMINNIIKPVMNKNLHNFLFLKLSQVSFVLIILFFSIVSLLVSNYNPFIYFRF